MAKIGPTALDTLDTHGTLTLQVKQFTKRSFKFKFVMLIYELLEDRRAGFSLILK